MTNTLIEEHIPGLQFHIEMTKEELSELIKNSKEELNTNTAPFIQSSRTISEASHFEENHQVMRKLLDRFPSRPIV